MPPEPAWPRPPAAARLRAFALWATMRALPYPRSRRLSDRGVLRPLERLLLRGDFAVRGGLATHSRISAVHFDAWGAQSFLFLTGAHEPMVQEALRRSLPAGGVMYDVGANVGFATLLAAGMVGPQGVVVAFEPQAESAEAVRVNARLNGLGQVRVIEAAVGARSGRAELLVVADGLWTRLAAVGEHEFERERRTVELVALDDLVAAGRIPPPDVVKIDVEGAELEVIEGMETILRVHRPVVICEMHGKNREFCARLRASGYRVVNLDEPGPVDQAGGNVHAFCEPAG